MIWDWTKKIFSIKNCKPQLILFLNQSRNSSSNICLNYFAQCVNLFVFTFSSIWLWLYPNAPCQSCLVCLFDCLSACLSVSLFVCLYALIYFIWKWCSLLPSPTDWVDHLGRNLRATNETRTTRFPCVAATSTHPSLPPPSPPPHAHIYNLALVEAVGRAVFLWLPAIFISFLSRTLCSPAPPDESLQSRPQDIYRTQFPSIYFYCVLKATSRHFQFPPSLSLSLAPFSYLLSIFFGRAETFS